MPRIKCPGRSCRPANEWRIPKLYELQVARDARCDEGVSTLSIVKNETEDGKMLPPSPGIWFLDGTPKEAVKSNTHPIRELL
jgi:hypothetical protein